MVSLFILALQFLACLGLGAYTLHFLQITKKLNSLEKITWAFALGFGLLGWILFFVGILNLITDFVLLIILFLGASGTIILVPKNLRFEINVGKRSWLDFVDAIIILLLATVLTGDLIEAISPPADADSLAYHFQIPKQFYISGGIEFIPRAIDGAIPLLVHMTYLPVYGLGGELALTMWTMLSGWGAAGLIFSFLSQWSGRKWALLITLVYMTTPAVVFGGGSGHVEVRLILFLLLASWSMTKLIFDNDWRFGVVAGLSLGFLIGSKFTGLVFGAALISTLFGFMVWRREAKWFSISSVVLLCVIFAGGQWYIWNWFHTGDPIFPILFEILNLSDSDIWDTQHHNFLKSYISSAEQAVPRNVFWFFAYPFAATFGGPRIFESDKIGFGPYLVLIFPLVMIGMWHFRDRFSVSKLSPVITIVIITYFLWFFFGPSQRVRHLLPAYALLMAATSLIALRLCNENNRKYALGICIGIVVSLQIGGQAIATVNYARYVFTSETREEFFARNLTHYPAVQWVNANLNPTDKLYTTFRQLNYLSQIPIYYANSASDALVDIRPTANNPRKFFRQILKQEVTHLLVGGLQRGSSATGANQWIPLAQNGCLSLLKSIKSNYVKSRALQILIPGSPTNIYHITPEKCGLHKSSKRTTH